MNLGTFLVTDVVLHDVPRHDEHADLTLTDAPIVLDEQLREYFKRKIVGSLELQGLGVVADPDGSPVVRSGVAAVVSDPTQLVSVSKNIAHHLDASQTNRNPAGLLAVVHGAIDGGPCLAVLKLEREQGLRFRITSAGGRTTVDLQFLRDLTLTDKTRVFKTSILCLESDGQPQSMHGWVSDSQRGRDDGSGVATFFMATFLGCKVRTSPEQATRDFVNAAERFINTDVSDPEKKARYQIALLATLHGQALDLSPQQFAEDHVEPMDREAFLGHMSSTGLDKAGAFEKDLSLVKASGFRMVFEHGMALVGSREDLEERVTVQGGGVEIADSIKRLSGR